MQTDALLTRFLTGLKPLSPLAVWAHGSLAGGDYQEGRSDLDLIAVLESTPSSRTVWRLATLHARLLRADPLAAKLHCTYLTPGTADGSDRRHLTYAQERLFRRPVTPVTRRELHTFGRVLDGEEPEGLLPPVSDLELDAFVVRDQREFWRPSLARPKWWRDDAMIDVGLTTFARATATLRGRGLISKRQALELLPALGAPAEVVEDIRRRRYDERPAPSTEEWTARRGELARSYLGPAIDELVVAYG